MQHPVTCPDCSTQRMVSQSSYSEYVRGKTTGRCRSCCNKARKYPGMKKPWKSGQIQAWNLKNLKPTSGLRKSNPNAYDRLHYWVETKLGKPSRCSQCYTTKYSIFHWANISGQYRQDLEDWIRLCPKCHRAYDTNRIILTGGQI